MRYFRVVLLGLILSACIKNQPQQTTSGLEIVMKELGSNDFLTEYNRDSTSSIHYVVDSSNFRTKVKFVICNVSTGNVVRRDQVVNGSVKWFTDYLVEVNEFTGISKGVDGNTNTYYIDARSGKVSNPDKVLE